MFERTIKIKGVFNGDESKILLEFWRKTGVERGIKARKVNPYESKDKTEWIQGKGNFLLFDKQVKNWIRTACKVGYGIEFVIEK